MVLKHDENCNHIWFTMQADGEKFSNRSSKISKQKHIVEQVSENGDIQYNCTACRKVFRSRSQRYYHINCNQLQNLAFKCEHCDKSFARRTQWKYHIESHLSPVNKCDKCEKTFSNPLALKKHLNLHKTEPKVCPHCDKTFKKKISLDQHISSQHLNNLQYGCACCNKKYASKSSLQLHLQTHEKKRFECSYCGKLFQRNSILNLHLKRHNNTNSYMCTVCKKTFSESGALARHSKLHQENVLQYYCKICDKSFLRKDNLTRHLTTIHPAEKFEDVVRIIKPLSTQSTESDVCNLHKSNQNNFKADSSFLIIENKQLRKPFDQKESLNILPKTSTKISGTEICKATNQIKVITAIPTSNEIYAKNSENSSQEFGNQFQSGNKHQQTDRMSETQMEDINELIKTESKVVNQNEIKREKIAFVSNNFVEDIYQTGKLFAEQKLHNCPDNFQAEKNEWKRPETEFVYEQQSVKVESTIEQAFPSVIMSVGNVKKDLTSSNILPIKTKNPITSEYKHKKYCRNNYNIDLYRKILGCDEDDDYKNIEKQQKYDLALKSSTPVHWRKCFKNNYETSAS